MSPQAHGKLSAGVEDTDRRGHCKITDRKLSVSRLGPSEGIRWTRKRKNSEFLVKKSQ